MAGFDAWFYVRPRDVIVVQACISAARRRARTLRVKFSSRSFENGAQMVFDGQTYALDIFLERLRRDLPTVAEATTSARTPADRRKVANGLIEILWRYRLQMYDRYGESWIPTLRGRTVPVTGVVHDLFPHNAPQLQERLLVTMDLLASWHFDEVAPSVLVEEMHTAAELLMKSTGFTRSSRRSFRELVDAAQDAGYVSAIEAGTLLALKTVRNDVKHDGDSGADGWLRDHFWDVTRALESLTYRARPVPAS